jgi:hypothetical protein
MEAISEERGPEEIPVLVDFEAQHWMAEALESATRTTGLIIGRVASMTAHGPNPDWEEAGALDPAASRATQAVMKAATANPLSDAQLERIVKLALGKRVPVAPAVMAGGNPTQATTSAVRPAGNHQAEPEVVSENEGESHATDYTGPEGPPPARGVVQPASPESREAAALGRSEAPVAQPPGENPSVKTMVTVPGGRRKSRAARKAARVGPGGRRRIIRCGWQPSPAGRGAAAVPSIRLHKGAHPRRLPDLPGHGAERVCSVCSIL